MKKKVLEPEVEPIEKWHSKIIRTIRERVKTSESIIIVAVLVITVILFLVFAVFFVLNITNKTAPATSGKYPKVLILGIDAATWDIITPMLERGRLPNIAKLMREGVVATPETQNPTISPAIWTTIATGKFTDKHGIRNFLDTSENYEYQFVGSENRTAKALWNILSDKGDKIGLFSYWATWPPEKINGYVVTDMALIDSEKGISPSDLRGGMITNSIRALGINPFGDGFKLEFPEPKDQNDENFFEAAKSVLGKLDKLFNSNSLYLFDKEKPDVLMQINGTVDASQHLFLKFLWPEKYPYPVASELTMKYGDYINELYESQDALVGEYLKRSGPDTNIIVLSDHGVFIDPASGYRFLNFNVLLSQLGFLTFNEDGSVDYGKTIAFECNNNTFDWQRRTCINLEGRYESGIVAQEDFKKTRDEIIEALNTVKTPDGESLFISIEPSTSFGNDINYDIKRTLNNELIIVNGVYRRVKDYLKLSIESGNHYANPVGPKGIIIWKGPNIKQGERVDLRYEDIMPNLLHSLGYPIGKDMDGVYLPGLYINPKEPEYIDSYEDFSTRLTIASLESIEENDAITVNGNTMDFHSDISGDDQYDSYCVNVIAGKKLALMVDDYSTSDNSADGDLQRIKYLPVDELPSYSSLKYDLHQLSFRAEDKEKYNVVVPLELNKPSYLGLWTNTDFRIELPKDGILRVIARGAQSLGEWPKMDISQGAISKTITIDSEIFRIYDIPLKAGIATIGYGNDVISDKGDRNLYIEDIYFTEAVYPASELPLYFYKYNDKLCLTNKSQGTTDASFTLVEIIEKDRDEPGQSALDLLHETGAINEEENQ
ncbi:alkaline phosphatase family protein [Patescibacteria group bacterium]|nr:alkaline phosphatase family protein [Patescibacteria group bacterium]